MEDDRFSTEDDLLAEIARLYYEDGLTQQEIGRRFGISHSSVSRMLREMRTRGIVEIRINYPLPRSRDLEERLVERFGLRGARVLVSRGLSAPEVLRRMGQLAARALAGLLTSRSILGISWGTAVAATVEAMPQMNLPDASAVQLIGGVGSANPSIDGIELARLLGQRLGCRYHYLHAPLIVPSSDVRNVLVNDPSIASTLDLARRADLALVGVGSVEPEYSSLVRAGFLSREETSMIVQLGAAGDVCAQSFNLAGEECAPQISHRVVGISLEELRLIPVVMGVAGGQAKFRAIAGALRGRHIRYLVTDTEAAEAVLQL